MMGSRSGEPLEGFVVARDVLRADLAGDIPGNFIIKKKEDISCKKTSLVSYPADSSSILL